MLPPLSGPYPPENTSAQPRLFNVGDALILMGALCLGLSGIRDRVRTLPWRAFWWFGEYRRFRAEATRGCPDLS